MTKNINIMFMEEDGAGLRKQLDKKTRGVKTADERRMDELRVEAGVKESLAKLVTSKLKWADRVE